MAAAESRDDDGVEDSAEVEDARVGESVAVVKDPLAGEAILVDEGATVRDGRAGAWTRCLLDVIDDGVAFARLRLATFVPRSGISSSPLSALLPSPLPPPNQTTLSGNFTWDPPITTPFSRPN